MNHSPAQVVGAYLVDEDAFGDPEGRALSWPLYNNFMPDHEGVPDECAALYDTEGLHDGRLMDGSVITHPGLQLRVRSKVASEGWTKIEAAAVALSELLLATVTLDSTTYTVASVTQVGTPIFLGAEEGTKRRFLHTLNLLVTLRQEEA